MFYCSECKRSFHPAPDQRNRKTCSHECSLKRKYRLRAENDRKEKQQGVCIICQKPFTRIQQNQKACGSQECKRALKASLQKKYQVSATRPRVRNVGCGPNEPLNSMRKCHDCGAATWDYRCAPCRAKWRAQHGADWLNGLADLFTAGRCYADVRP